MFCFGWIYLIVWAGGMPDLGDQTLVSLHRLLSLEGIHKKKKKWQPQLFDEKRKPEERRLFSVRNSWPFNK